MIKVENIDVYGFEAAIRGMRNPMNSWGRSDSWCCKEYCPHVLYNTIPANYCKYSLNKFCIGENDFDLMKRLFKAGTEHRKYLRMINVTMDITAPLYWWKEFDTYKVSTVSNSCSTMHKIHAKEFTLDDFSHEHSMEIGVFESIIETLNFYRNAFIMSDEELKSYWKSNLFEDTPEKKKLWLQMIQLLPSSYNQRRTVQFNYETLFNIIRQREHHKLDEWVELVKILKDLPYIKELME